MVNCMIFAALLQPLSAKNILFPQGECQLVGHGGSDVEGAADEGTLHCSGKLDMKALREDEGVGEPELDGPEVIEELSLTAALKPHS